MTNIKDKKKQVEYVTQWRVQHPDRLAEQRFLYKERIRNDVLTAYSKGDVPECVCCGETIKVFLAIDHIDGGGSKHRKELGMAGTSYYLWLRKNGYPEGYQVLCHNCNFAKVVCKVCPHKMIGVSL